MARKNKSHPADESVHPLPSHPPEQGPHPSLEPILDENLDTLSALQLVDLLTQFYPLDSPRRIELGYLRRRIEELEVLNDQARQAVEKLDAAVTKLTSPANRVGTLLNLPKPDTALIVNGGTEFYCSIDPRLAQSKLLVGTRVLLNEAYVVIGDLGFETGGPVAKIQDLLPDGRLRVGQEGGLANTLVLRSAGLGKEKLKPGLEVRLDSSQRVALEVVAGAQARDHLLEQVPELPWEKVGGQDEARQAVRDAVELPLLHADLFKSYQHTSPKGILLYGPPGCGKTLLGKATAYNLTRQLRERTGVDHREYFMHVKGPEILNMWVGESERQVRELFARAREKAKEGFLPFIFIDEAESILGTRRAGRTSGILNTLVPMFCAEMDGIESLQQMVIILASNRADMIDPAILRPGRIDRKIKVSRPTRQGSEEIYRIYLTPNLPLDPELLREQGDDRQKAVDAIIAKVIDAQFSRREDNRFLEVTLRSGRHEYLHRGDLVSGAIIAGIVERAKETAIKRAIASPEPTGLSIGDFIAALDVEYKQNDIFPPNDITEDWLKLVDYDPENVVKLSPVKPRRTEASAII
ncbi:MAG: AAA family ATPase [Methylacidiphilales bacterium]|nr:AAA family ATPase [Candidatus Methylacidiphilales bacterium]